MTWSSPALPCNAIESSSSSAAGASYAIVIFGEPEQPSVEQMRPWSASTASRYIVSAPEVPSTTIWFARFQGLPWSETLALTVRPESLKFSKWNVSLPLPPSRTTWLEPVSKTSNTSLPEPPMIVLIELLSAT